MIRTRPLEFCDTVSNIEGYLATGGFLIEAALFMVRLANKAHRIGQTQLVAWEKDWLPIASP